MTLNSKIITALSSSIIIKVETLYDGKIDEKQIDTEISFALSSYGIQSIDEEDRSQIVKQIENGVRVKHSLPGYVKKNYDNIEWYTNNKAQEEFYWDRYRSFLIKNRELDIISINKLEGETLPAIMNSLANPKDENLDKTLVRGLVVGDVQSGKTSTYAGLISKAADSGYKVIILLTGVTESLRKQTQERMEEDIIGYTIRTLKNKKVETEFVGVGLSSGKTPATAYTSYDSDFGKSNLNVLGSLDSANSIVMFIVKKNAKVLATLKDWLADRNIKTNNYVDYPMLLVDDEADNASINTSKVGDDPTTINRSIRQICSLFRITSYVGFTATPFANVFINPQSPSKPNLGEDLFPEDFIYVLPTPSTYIGAEKIFRPDGPYYSSIKYINDIEEPDPDDDSITIEDLNRGGFYYGHKKEWDGIYPDSLTEALYCFVLANVIYDLRGEREKPRTMLVNMSRFVSVQKKIKEHIEKLYRKVYDDIQYEFSYNQSENFNLPTYKRLKELYLKHYGDLKDKICVEQVLDKQSLLDAINFQIIIVNSSKSSEKLDYKKNKSLRAIAVGGMALSRGLTLKGLLVSYFYRNTSTFDVLMQMGRWFGYRLGYDDIFQIWTKRESVEYYRCISQATEELKQDIRQMCEEKLTPKDFGLKVHNISENLRITAANKMRTSYDYEEGVSIWGTISETPYISRNIHFNQTNLSSLRAFENVLLSNHFSLDKVSEKQNEQQSRFIKDVPRDIVVDFLKTIKVSRKNFPFDPEQIIKIIDTDKHNKLSRWDVVYRSGNAKECYSIGEVKIAYSIRNLIASGGTIGFSGRGTLGGTNHGQVGISPKEINDAKRDYDTAHDRPFSKDNSYPNKTWFKFVTNRNPLLSIYLIQQDKTEDDDPMVTKFVKELGSDPIVAFSIGFPSLDGIADAEKIKYKVNQVFNDKIMEDELPEDEIDEQID